MLFEQPTAILGIDMQEDDNQNQPIQPPINPDVRAPAEDSVPQPQASVNVPPMQTTEPVTAQPVETQVQSKPKELTQQNSKKPKKEAGLLSFFGTLVIAFVLVQVINLFLFQSYKVFGSSMFPTLHDGDRLIISKVGKTTSRLQGKDYEPKRGDIIVFIDPQRSDLQLIKRVIGLPGERVVVKDGTLTVYNTENPDGFNPDDADYGKSLPKTSGQNDVSVPEGNLFVSGDNREGSNSLDSRNELGTVPKNLVIGTLKVRIWPFDGAKFF